MKAKEFLHKLSLYDGNNDQFEIPHRIYKTPQLMEMYAEAQQKEIEQLKKENRLLVEMITYKNIIKLKEDLAIHKGVSEGKDIMMGL